MKAISLITALLLGCITVMADQISLKNGDRISGTVLKSDGKVLVFKSDLVGDLTVSMSDITELASEKPVYVGLADGRTVVGGLRVANDQSEVKATSGAVTFSRGAIQFIRSEAEQLAYEDALNPGWMEQWTGGADLGIAITKGNSDTTNVALGLGMSRETRSDKTTLYGAGIYNRENTNGVSRTVANTIRFGGRYDRNINEKWFGYGFSDLERNGVQLLNLRWVIGGGIGYHAIKNERTQLDLLGGLAMNREYFKGIDNDRTSLETQIGQTLSHKFNSRTTLKEQLFFFPNLTRGGEYRINFDTSLVTDITKRIAWQITFSDRYLSDPPLGSKQNDMILTTGLRVKLGIMK
jgi:putative salt-induced outer membrane protein YdiY